MTKKNGSDKKVRVNMRIGEDLVKWVKRYAKKKRTNMTRIFTDHLVQLKEGDGNSSVNR